MRDIFISYRRTDSSDVTGRICDHLKMRLGDNRLFKDVDSIPLGGDFRKAIFQSVGSCRVLLAVIGSDWLKTVDEQGTRRIDDPDDYVHLEIAAAIDRGIPVIPVLVANSQMPREHDLPKNLRDLAYRNAALVRPDPDFRGDIDRLSRQLSDYLQDFAPSVEEDVSIKRTNHQMHANAVDDEYAISFTRRAAKKFSKMPVEAQFSVAFAAIGVPAWFLLLVVSTIGASWWEASIVPLSFLFAVGLVFNISGIVMALRGMKLHGDWHTVLWAGAITNTGEALAIVVVLVLAWSRLGGA